MSFPRMYFLSFLSVIHSFIPFYDLTIAKILVLIVVDLKRLEVQARDGPSDPNALAKWRILNRLHDRNETMYYRVCSEFTLALL